MEIRTNVVYLPMSFWENVEFLREEQDTSYRWLAQKMGVSETTVSSMRKANTEPRATEAVKIARALGTSVETLVGNIAPETTPAAQDSYFEKYITLKHALRQLTETL